jgi:Tfp pilus assembly protein PilN
VRANLLPESILQLKAAQKTKSYALIAIVGGVAVVLVGLAATFVSIGAAQAQLDAAQTTSAELAATQRSYSDVSGVLSDIDGIESQLERIFVNDITPGTFLTGLRAIVPEGVTISSVNATFADASVVAGAGDSVGASSATLDDSGQLIIGSLDFTGSAPDESGVATLITNVGNIEGLTVPYIVSIRDRATGGVEFTAQASVTSTSISGRFAAEEGEAE